MRANSLKNVSAKWSLNFRRYDPKKGGYVGKVDKAIIALIVFALVYFTGRIIF